MELEPGGSEGKAADSDLARDRNLLFGVLALQLRFIQPADFLDAAAAWSTDPSRNVAERLMQGGHLQEKDRRLVEGIIDEAVQQHDGDVHRTLETFGGEAAVAEQISRFTHTSEGREAVTRLGIPLDVTDIDADSISAVVETPGRYTRDSEYSRGGMGRILLVHDEYLSRDVALKELIPPSDRSYPAIEGKSPVHAMSSMVVRFLREAKLTGQLEHPSIVPVYELGRRPNGTLYYTMKLVRGQTLAQALRQVKTLRERLTFLTHYVDLCQAIGYAHSRNVIHRDIKPTNVMIGEFGETVVIDWGLAKVVGQADIYEDQLRETWSKLRGRATPDPAQTATGAILGTPHYMAPEQAKGHIDEIDQRTDVFALGIVLYEILTGKVPFDGKNTKIVVERVVAASPTPVRDLAPDAPPELASICMKAMNKSPDRRYEDAKALATDVQRFLTGAVVHAYEYSAGEVLSRFYKRHRGLVNAAAAALIVVIGLAIASYINIRNARDDALDARNNEAAARVAESDARAEAQDKTYIGQLRLARQYVETGHFDLARETLWATDPGRRGWAWGFLLNRLGQDLFTIPDFNTAVVSPDGERIAARSNSHPISVFDANDGSLVVEFDPLTQRYVNEIEFSPDGRFLVAGCMDRTARVWDARTGEIVHTLRGHRSTPYSATFDATGSRILTAGGRTARVWNAETGDAETVFNGHCRGNPDCVVWRAGFVPQSRLAYSYGDEGIVRIWDTSTGLEVLAIEGSSPAVHPDGTHIAVAAGVDAQLWNVETGTKVAELSGHRAFIWRVVFSPSGDEVVTVAEDGSIRVWNTLTGDEIRQFFLPGRFHRLAFSSDGRLLACINGDGLIKIWDFQSGEELKSIKSQNSLAYSIQFYDNDRRLMTAARESQVMVWGVHWSVGQTPIISMDTAIQAISLSADNTHLAVMTNDNRALLVNRMNGAIESALSSFHFRFTYPIAISPTGRTIVAATDPFVPFMLDTSAMNRVVALEGHEGQVRSLDYSNDGRFIVSTSWDETARIWDGESGTLIHMLEGHSDTVVRGVFSPDSTRLLTVSADGSARTWDVNTGELQGVFRGHESEILDADWDSAGTRFVTSGEDETIRIWDAETGAEDEIIHTAGASSLVRFTRSGRLLFARTGGGATVHRVDSGEQLLDALAFDPIAPSLLSPMSDERSVIVLDTTRKTVWRLESAPWRESELPGTSAEDWPSRYERYRAAQRTLGESSAAYASQTDIPMVMVTTTETLRRRTERFRRLLLQPPATADAETAPEDGPGLSIIGERSEALARVGIRDGDRILAIENRTTDDAAAAAAALDRWSQTAAESLRLTLSRGGHVYDARIVTMPRRTLRRTISLDRETAITILSDLIDARGGSLDAANELSRDFLEAAGETAPGGESLYGFYYSLPNAQPLKAHALRLGIATGDWIRSINGAPIANVQQLIDDLTAVIEALQAGEDRTVTVEIDRGEFIQITNEIRIQ